MNVYHGTQDPSQGLVDIADAGPIFKSKFSMLNFVLNSNIDSRRKSRTQSTYNFLR